MTRRTLLSILALVAIRELAADDLEPVLARLDRTAKGAVELSVASVERPDVPLYRVLAAPTGWAVLVPQGPHEDDDVVWLSTPSHAWRWTPGALDPARIGRYQPLLARPWRIPATPYGRILAYRDLSPERYALAHWLRFAWFARTAIDPAWTTVAADATAITVAIDGARFRRAIASAMLADRPLGVGPPARFAWSWSIAPDDATRVVGCAWHSTWDDHATRGRMRVLEWQTQGDVVLPRRIEVVRLPVERVRDTDPSTAVGLVVTARAPAELPTPPARPARGLEHEPTQPAPDRPPLASDDTNALVERAEDARTDVALRALALARIGATSGGGRIRRELELARADLGPDAAVAAVDAMLAEPDADASADSWDASRRDLVRLLLACARDPALGERLAAHPPFAAMLARAARDPGVAAARLGSLEGSIRELQNAGVAQDLVAARAAILAAPRTPFALVLAVLDEVSRRGKASAAAHLAAWQAARPARAPDPATPAGLRADLAELVFATRGKADTGVIDRVVRALARFDPRASDRAALLAVYRLAMRHVGREARLAMVDALAARLDGLDLDAAREVAQLIALEVSLMPPALGAEVLARVAAASPGRVEEILDGAALKWLSARALLADPRAQELPVVVRARLALQDGRVREAFALLRANLATASEVALDQLGRLVVESCPIADGGALDVSKEHWLDADAAWDLVRELSDQRPDPVLLAHRARLAMRIGTPNAGKHAARALELLLAPPRAGMPALAPPRARLALELLTGASLDAPDGALATWSALVARAYDGPVPQPLLGAIADERGMVLALIARECSPALLERLAWLIDRDPAGFEPEPFANAMEALAKGAARPALDVALARLVADSPGERLIRLELARHGDRSDDERQLLDALLAEAPRLPWLWARRIELARRRAGWVELVPELRRALVWMGDEARRDLLVTAIDALYVAGESEPAHELARDFVRLHPRHALHTSPAPLALVLRHGGLERFDVLFAAWVEGSKLDDTERRFVELDLLVAGGQPHRAYGALAPLRTRPELADRVLAYERTLAERYGADLPFDHFLATAAFPDIPEDVREDIDYQIEQLGSRNFAARARAEDALRTQGAAAGRALLAGVADKNPEIRHRCRALLRSIFEANGGRPLEPKDPDEGD